MIKFVRKIVRKIRNNYLIFRETYRFRRKIKSIGLKILSGLENRNYSEFIKYVTEKERHEI